MKKCYYCGKTFEDLAGLNESSRVKNSKFGQAYAVCSKKCEVKFNALKLSKITHKAIANETEINEPYKNTNNQTNTKLVSKITVSEISDIIFEVSLKMKKEGIRERSFYYSQNSKGIKWDDVNHKLNDIIIETIETQFYCNTDKDWNISFFIFDEMKDFYTPRMSKDQIKNSALKIYSYLEQSKKSKGCLGSVFYSILIIVTFFIFIKQFTFKG